MTICRSSADALSLFLVLLMSTYLYLEIFSLWNNSYVACVISAILVQLEQAPQDFVIAQWPFPAIGGCDGFIQCFV